MFKARTHDNCKILLNLLSNLEVFVSDRYSKQHVSTVSLAYKMQINNSPYFSTHASVKFNHIEVYPCNAHLAHLLVYHLLKSVEEVEADSASEQSDFNTDSIKGPKPGF